eukprot:6882562-Prymnesium_polylepis.1
MNRPWLLLILRLLSFVPTALNQYFRDDGTAGAPPEDGAAQRDGHLCRFTRREWLQHCAVAEDCTSESSFCPCCATHAFTEYATACAV